MRERTTHERGAVPHHASRERPQGLRISHCGRLMASPYAAFSVRVSPAGIEPGVGFRTKSDLRNHQAIIQPRLYDCLMVTQIIEDFDLTAERLELGPFTMAHSLGGA